jgi:chromosome segregation ATPase
MIRKLTLLALLALVPALHAAPEADPAAKMREQLKSVMLQLRASQTETANAQTAAATADAKAKDLEAQVAKLTKQNETLVNQANKDKARAEQDTARLNEKIADREKRIVEYNEALAKWKDGYQKAAAVARTKEDERATLASEAIVLKRTIADRESKNIALFNTSMEILDRFEKYALGKALSAREPFISTSRVKVENLVQDYKDKVIDNRVAAPAKNN